MKQILSIILTFLLLMVTLVSCGNVDSNNNNSDKQSNTNNGEQTNENNSSNQKDDESYISVKTLANTIRQENEKTDVNIIFANSKETLTINELFSYSNNHTIDIYSLGDSAIDYSKSEMALNVGYNHFQIKFKNLSDYSETFFDIEVFRDPGVITRKLDKYDLHKEITKSTGQNGLPKFDLKIYVSKWFDSNIDVNGEKLPTQMLECNFKFNYYADFYLDPENYLPSSEFHHFRTEFFSITHTFTDINETLETTIDFPQQFWDDYCSQYPYSTLENTKLGLNDRYNDTFVVYPESYILLRVDYSNYQFD